MSSPVWLHRYALVTAGMTWLLLCAGALVTGTGSGLSVPDWPLSFGTLFPSMTGGVFFEHGHRLIAGTVALLMFGLMCAFLKVEKRSGVRKLSVAAFSAVILQATLGGMTVLYGLPLWVSTIHACLAQIFFCSVVCLAWVTSQGWQRERDPLEDGGGIPLRYFSLLLSTLFFCQLFFGAWMRHLGAGLAVSDFPLIFGRLYPISPTLEVAVHTTHRMIAYSLVVLTLWFVIRIYRDHSGRLDLTAWAGTLLSLLILQFLLGALTIWLRRPVWVTTIHLANGALCFASSVALTVTLFRLSSRRWLPRKMFAAVGAT